MAAAVVDYDNARGTGTPVHDASEATPIHKIFDRCVSVPWMKGHFGHTLGAAVVLFLEAMGQDLVHVALNFGGRAYLD